MNSWRSDPADAARGWISFAGCLAYAESLGDPDTHQSQNRARELLGSGYKKHSGVKFYYDKGHSNPASRWNVGLYQFVLRRGGNISPCIRAWRALKLPASDALPHHDLQTMARFIGSPSQSFNVFCGIHKMLQTFYVQVYTNDPRRTHPFNSLDDGKLKPPAERCVSIHGGRAYSHFSPPSRGRVYIDNEFKRSGNRSNFHKLMRCTMAVLGE